MGKADLEYPNVRDLQFTGICDPNNSRARHHRNLKLGSKSKYLNILIPSFVIQVVLKNQNVAKLNINWLFG